MTYRGYLNGRCIIPHKWFEVEGNLYTNSTSEFNDCQTRIKNFKYNVFKGVATKHLNNYLVTLSVERLAKALAIAKPFRS